LALRRTCRYHALTLLAGASRLFAPAPSAALSWQQLGVAKGPRGACEILGLEPICVANEGRFAIVPLEHADTALNVLLRCLFPDNPPAPV